MNKDSGLTSFYKDGIFVMNATGNDSDVRWLPLQVERTRNYIGAYYPHADNYFDGNIRSLNIWKRALSSLEIKYIYDQGRNFDIYSLAPKQIDDFELIRNIKHSIFFEPDNYQDRTGNSTVTLHNNPTIDSDGLNLVQASTQYATLNETNIGGTITFSMWYNRHIDPGITYVRLFELQNSGGSDRMTLYYGKSDPRTIDSSVYHGTSSPGSTGEVSVVRPNEAEWHHIVWVINDDNDTRYMYLDGTLVSSQTGATNAPVKMVRTNNYIGTVEGLNEKCFDGNIKSFNIWERALSSQEIAHIYAQGRNYNLYGVSYTLRRTLLTDIQYSFFFEPGNFQDRTGNLTPTLVNNPTINSDGLNLVRANNQYLDLGTTYTGGTFTIAFWFNHNSTGNWSRIFEFGNGFASQKFTNRN